MASNTLKRNIFTEKLFQSIEEPWSNESTPTSTPAKQTKVVCKSNSASLSLDILGLDGVQNDVIHGSADGGSESLDDEPDFIVWKLAEKLFLHQMRNVSAVAFDKWVMQINGSIKSKRLSQKARILHRRKLQLKMFNNWYGSVILISRFAKKKVEIEKFRKSKTKRCLNSFFAFFKLATVSVHLNSAMHRRFCHRLMRSSMEKWLSFSVARARSYTKALKMAYKLCLRVSFCSWSCHVRSNRRLECVLRVFQRRMVRKNVLLCFKRWYQSKMTTLSMPSKSAWLTHHLDTLLRKRCTAAIKAWNRISVHRRHVRSMFLKTLCRKMFSGQVSHESWCLQSAISTWFENIRENTKPDRQESSKRTRATKSFSLGSYFNSWAKCCVMDKKVPHLVLKLRIFKSKTFLKQCYCVWKTIAKAFRVAVKKADDTFKYRSLNRKMRSFMIWKHVLASSLSASTRSADAFHTKTLRRKHFLLWNKWKQRTMRRILLERAYKSRARQRLSVSFSLRSLFGEWKMGILSEQFFARYSLTRFFGLWRLWIGSTASSDTPSITPDPTTFPIQYSGLELVKESDKRSISQIYKRKVMRIAVHGWAWSCSQRSVLLEKLQIAYMIRSSIRTCTKHFAAWSNETLKTSQTSIMSAKPVTPISSQCKPSLEPADTEQRTFEILNIALVERILWSITKRRLIHQKFKLWLRNSRGSNVARKIQRIRALKCSFYIWSELSAHCKIQRGLMRLAPAIKLWKRLTHRNLVFLNISTKIKNRNMTTQMIQGMCAWCTYTFGRTKAKLNKCALQSCKPAQCAWKDVFFYFQSWCKWTKTSEFRVVDSEAAAKSRFMDTLFRKYFNSWRYFCLNVKKSKTLRETTRIGSMSVFFKVWSRCAFVKRKADKIILSLQNYQATSMLLLCWNAWRAGLEQRNYRTLTLSVTGKLIQKCNAVSVPVRIAWNAWRNFISTRRFVRLAKEKIARKICEKANFRNMFRRWRFASRRRRNISCALAKSCTASLRRAFFALKYSIVRSVFFARQYQRISRKFQRQNKHEVHTDGSFQQNTQKMKQEFSNSDSQLEQGILEEKVLKLQSEKIELMEQLKSALQGMQKESISPTIQQALKKETISINVHDNIDHSNDSRPPTHKLKEVSSCHHTSFPVQSRRQTNGSSKTPSQPPHSFQQHPLFPVLSHDDYTLGDFKQHPETKVRYSAGQKMLVIHSCVFLRRFSCPRIRHRKADQTLTTRLNSF
jgi:hypothetical protein